MSQASHLYFDHPYEPDPEERGLYWATRYTDTRKAFGFMPEHLYDSFEIGSDGNSIDDYCSQVGDCVKPQKLENIIGECFFKTHIFLVEEDMGYFRISFCNRLNPLNGWLAQRASHVPISLRNRYSINTLLSA